MSEILSRDYEYHELRDNPDQAAATIEALAEALTYACTQEMPAHSFYCLAQETKALREKGWLS